MTRHEMTTDVARETTVAPCDCATSMSTPRTAPAVRYESTITCPACGVATHARMPRDACQFFWECPACGTLLRPLHGDCCVFCSYADTPCPPIQLARQRPS